MVATAAGGATSTCHQYDVFLNHRGPDVKKTLVAHLYAALSIHGFRPFLDAEDIGYTLPVFEEIDKALKGACVHVAIFSKGYVESIYCLDELCDMLKSGKPIIPVFYDVEARDLRRIEDGLYNNAFIKHQKRGRTQKIPIWKEALRKVVDYKAIRMDEVNRNEHQLIKRILEEVRISFPPDLLPGKRFGLEKSMKDVVKTLESVSVIGLVGMGGIGKTTLAVEIYNHFLSRQHFEYYCFLQDVRSSQTSVLREKVLRDLRLESGLSCNDQEYRRMLNGALKDRRVLVIVDDISDANQFEALIPEILIIPGLDCRRIVITSRRHDVLNHVMKALPVASKSVYEVQMLDKFDSRRLFNIHAFMSETPKKDFVKLAETIADACGGLPLALEVMGCYLFDKEKPEDKEIWSEAVKVLQENPDIMDKLRVSYDGLPTNGDREMFQDIACMLIGVKQEVAMTIWKSCTNCNCSSSKTPASSLRNLMDRSLVKLDEYGRLRMHDVLRDMGREIVKTDGVKGQALPPKKWRHLWDQAIAKKELSRGKMNTKVRGICLTIGGEEEDYEDYEDQKFYKFYEDHRFYEDDRNYQDSKYIEDLEFYEEDQDYENRFLFSSTMSCEASNLGSMKELHLLNLDGCNVVDDDFSSWLQQLRWLQWRFSSFRNFPPHLKFPHLVVLDLSYSTKLTCLWKQNVHVMLPLLEELILVGCSSLVALPENLGANLPRLKRLKLNGCWRLKRLPNSIVVLIELEHLDLQQCSNLITLTNAFAESVKLAKLVILDLTNCRKLTCMWENDATIELPLLEELVLVGCSSLVALPENLGRSIPRLNTLAMRGCKSLQMLPKSIGPLTKLEHLDLRECSDLITLTNTFVELLPLLHLGLDGCSSLVALPKNLGTNVPRLKTLTMRACKSLWTLPYSIGLLTQLEHLGLGECSNLITFISPIVDLVNLAKLIRLDLNCCEKLTYLWENDAHIELPKLEQLNLVGCSSLVQLPENLGKSIPSLKTLKMRGCKSLRMLPNSIGLLTELENLDLKHCSNLITFISPIVEMVNLAKLIRVDLDGCEKLTRLWENDACIELPLLKCLRLEFCSSLVQLPENLGKSIPRLKTLEMTCCRSLQSLPKSIGLLTELEHVDLRGCHSLITFMSPIMGMLPLLERLRLEGCSSLVALPENLDKSAPRLNTMAIRGWKSLQTLPNSIGLLTELKHLEIGECSNLITFISPIVKLVNLAKLIRVDLDWCEKLTHLWENDARIELPLLEELRLVGCPSLVGLPENLDTSTPRLKTLAMSYCTSIRTIPKCVCLLTEVQHLDLAGCSNLTTFISPIVELVNLGNLIRLDLSSCETLTYLWENDARIELPLLEELILVGCSSLVALPENLGTRVPRLKRLAMSGWKTLRTIPISIGLLTKLEYLDLEKCSILRTFLHPIVEFVNLAKLFRVDLSWCETLRYLWKNDAHIELPLLEELRLVGCSRLVALPENLGTSAPRLKTLTMRGCKSLQMLPNSIGLLRELRHFNLGECSILMTFIHPIVKLVNLGKLIQLDLGSCKTLTYLWENDANIELPLLKWLRLEGCTSLVALPENLGTSAPRLRTLKMRGCKSLRVLPNFIGHLTKLEHFHLQECSNLITFICPIVELVNMAKLVGLDLSCCEKLTFLWENDARIELPLLKWLRLEGCTSLVALPENLDTSISRLKTLKMSCCRSLRILPKCICILTKLEYLDFGGCHNLIAFVSPFVNMVNLGKLIQLDLSYCETLTYLWENDARIELPLLEELRLVGCSSLVALPENLGTSAPRLETLAMRGCKSLWMLPNSICLLTKLEHLDLGECSKLITFICLIVDLVNLGKLIQLDLSSCETLTYMWENDARIELPRLQELVLVGCFSLIELPENLGTSAPRLRTLKMRGCKSLRMLPNSIGLLTELEHLHLQECSNLIACICPIVELVNLANLFQVNLSFCETLFYMWENDVNIELPLLEELILLGCSSLVALPENLGTSTPRLKILVMKGCKSLWTLPNSVGLLTELEHLDLQECSNLVAFICPIVELVNLPKLIQVDLSCCEKLTYLWKNDARIELPLLEELRLVGCSSLIALPNNLDTSAPRLKTLAMSGCESLWMLPNSIGLLTTLQILDVVGCSDLITL